MTATLERDGFLQICTKADRAALESARDSLFSERGPGKRCLLDNPLVKDLALALREELVDAGHLPGPAVAIQAIAFDKTPGKNWIVSWHQDLMFPFLQPVSAPGFELPCRKDGVPYARPPIEVLQEMLAVRLHLDDCNESNGPLRVSPGTHRCGILQSSEVASSVAKHGERTCVASAGEALLLRPLLLHRSARAEIAQHRRILHFVYHSGRSLAEKWHRAIGRELVQDCARSF